MNGLQKTLRALLATALWMSAALAVAQTASRPSEVIYVHGDALVGPRVMSPQDLRELPAEIQGSFTQTRKAGGTEQSSTVRGVKLPALIERIGLNAHGKAQWKNLLITATATDGYRAVFTWTELSNSPNGEGVLVLHERDGKPMEPREGLISMQASTDFRLGARHVRNLSRIEVQVLQ